MGKSQDTTFFGLSPTVCFVITLYLMGWAVFTLLTLKTLYDYAVARGYAATEGVIERATATTLRGGVSYGFEYAYEVDGQVYRGRRVSVGPVDNDALTRGWGRGTRVTVYYDPRDPRRAVLIRDLSLSHGWGWPLFVLITLSPLPLWLLLRRYARR
jgi:hypothetical protein